MYWWRNSQFLVVVFFSVDDCSIIESFASTRPSLRTTGVTKHMAAGYLRCFLAWYTTSGIFFITQKVAVLFLGNPGWFLSIWYYRLLSHCNNNHNSKLLIVLIVGSGLELSFSYISSPDPMSAQDLTLCLTMSEM